MLLVGAQLGEHGIGPRRQGVHLQQVDDLLLIGDDLGQVHGHQLDGGELLLLADIADFSTGLATDPEIRCPLPERLLLSAGRCDVQTHGFLLPAPPLLLLHYGGAVLPRRLQRIPTRRDGF